MADIGRARARLSRASSFIYARDGETVHARLVKSTQRGFFRRIHTSDVLGWILSVFNSEYDFCVLFMC